MSKNNKDFFDNFFESLEKKGVPKKEIEKIENFFDDTERFRIFLENSKQIPNQEKWVSDMIDVFLMALERVNRPAGLIKLINCYNNLWENVASLSDCRYVVSYDNDSDKKIK